MQLARYGGLRRFFSEFIMANSTAALSLASPGTHIAHEDEQRVIDEVTLSLKAEKDVITNKDLMLALISRLETETDVVQNDILRNALEIIVHISLEDL